MKEDLQFFPTGSTLLDCALGGGYVLGRLVTVAGLSATYKTGLSTEAAANFANTFPEGKITFLDAESAFDPNYASELGLPVERVEFVDASTVEEFSSVFDDFLEEVEEGVPSLFVLDSLDSLSTDKEVETKLADMTGYGAEKAKNIGIALRRVLKQIEDKNVCLLIIQQLRDNITGYGPKYKKSGGKAVGYYASQEITLKQNKILEKTIDKVTRPRGISVTFNTGKCRTGKPFQEGDFNILFGVGIDDVSSCINFLRTVEKLSLLPESLTSTKGKLLEKDEAIVERIERSDELETLRKDPQKNKEAIKQLSEEVKATRKLVSDKTKQAWNEIEDKHSVKRVSKY